MTNICVVVVLAVAACSVLLEDPAAKSNIASAATNAGVVPWGAEVNRWLSCSLWVMCQMWWGGIPSIHHHYITSQPYQLAHFGPLRGPWAGEGPNERHPYNPCQAWSPNTPTTSTHHTTTATTTTTNPSSARYNLYVLVWGSRVCRL